MLIFLISGKAEAGKDSFYEIATPLFIKEDYNIHRVAFGDGVKEVARSMGWNGEKDEAGRSGLIMVGDGARKYFDPNIWINKAIEKLSTIHEALTYMLNDETAVFVTDCRYKNEITMLKEWGEKYGHIVYTVRIDRPNHISRLTPEQLANPSECDLDNYTDWNIQVENIGTYDAYKSNVESAMELLIELHKDED